MSRILVLEPNDEIHTLFVRLLRRLGHEPLLEADAPDAVDIVLLEPSSESARRVLADVRARRPDVYVVCASIYPREDAAPVAPDAFLAKPVTLAALEGALPAVSPTR